MLHHRRIITALVVASAFGAAPAMASHEAGHEHGPPADAGPPPQAANGLDNAAANTADNPTPPDEAAQGIAQSQESSPVDAAPVGPTTGGQTCFPGDPCYCEIGVTCPG